MAFTGKFVYMLYIYIYIYIYISIHKSCFVELQLSVQSLLLRISRWLIVSIKRGTHLTFNAIRVLNKNVLTFSLLKVLMNVVFQLGNHMVLYRLFSTVDEILWKKSIHFTPFSKEYFLFILNIIGIQ